jgi:hypothetical protein
MIGRKSRSLTGSSQISTALSLPQNMARHVSDVFESVQVASSLTVFSMGKWTALLPNFLAVNESGASRPRVSVRCMGNFVSVNGISLLPTADSLQVVEKHNSGILWPSLLNCPKFVVSHTTQVLFSCFLGYGRRRRKGGVYW